MNYIYDILLNFHDKLYEFYDWNVDDNIINIRKIPIFLIPHKNLNDIKENEIIFDKSFLEQVKNKTEIFIGRNIKNIKYAFLLTDGFDIIAIKIGKKINYSSLQIEDELDILEDINLKEKEINYYVMSKKRNILKTRKQIEKENKIINKLKELKKENNYSKISYLYYECFNEKEKNIDKILNKLNSSLEDPDIFVKLDDFFSHNKLTFN